MGISRDYLEQLIHIRTPKGGRGIVNDERYQQCSDYSELRNYAKDLLENPQDTETEDKISKLIEKLKIEL